LGATIGPVPVSVVIVDDHPSFRRSARRMLEDAGFVVVGEAGDGGSALAAVAARRPRLVLHDEQLPETDGFTVAADLHLSNPGSVVVLTSARAAADFGSRLRECPARGFIPKAELSGPALTAMLPPSE
jgi:DNA-binding NarL/FixJ family response regulator